MYWKTCKYLLLIILLASLGFSVNGWLDSAVSLDHARQQQKIDKETADVLRRFVLVFNHGTKRSEITQFVKKYEGKDHVIKEEADRIFLDDLVFQFDNTQSLTKVEFLD